MTSTAKPGLHSLLTQSLLFGQDHPGLAMNVRKTDRDEGIEALASSIKEDGILQPLLVWRDTDGDGGDYVVDGSRRLTAVRALQSAANDVGLLETLPCLLIIGGHASDAMAKSLAANVMQIPLHPVDQYEAYASMPATWTAQQIADRFGTKVENVERRLALGHLAPTIRQAWRNGEIEADAAKTFTLEPDVKVQEKLWKKLGSNVRNAWRIRQEILGDNNLSHLIAFVGRDEYANAGGRVITDLFSENGQGDGVSDRALLKKMADAKVALKCADIEKAGWSFAIAKGDLPDNAYTWKRHQLKAKAATDAQKASMGAIVSVDSDGKFAIEYGVQKPGAKAPTKGAAAGKADKKAPAAPPKLSQNIEAMLARTATKGLAVTVAKNAPVALAALIAGFATRGSGPVRVDVSGLAMRDMDPAAEPDFADTFRTVRKHTPAQLNTSLATIAAAALDLVAGGDPNPFQETNALEIAKAVDAKALNQALRDAFDYQAYFDGVGKSFLLAAIRESDTAAETTITHSMATMSNTSLAGYCMQNVPQTGWLPAELRAPGYDGPKGKAAAKGKR